MALGSLHMHFTLFNEIMTEPENKSPGLLYYYFLKKSLENGKSRTNNKLVETVSIIWYCLRQTVTHRYFARHFFQKSPNPNPYYFPSKRLCPQYDLLVYDRLVISTALCTWKRMWNILLSQFLFIVAFFSITFSIYLKTFIKICMPLLFFSEYKSFIRYIICKYYLLFVSLTFHFLFCFPFYWIHGGDIC